MGFFSSRSLRSTSTREPVHRPHQRSSINLNALCEILVKISKFLKNSQELLSSSLVCSLTEITLSFITIIIDLIGHNSRPVLRSGCIKHYHGTGSTIWSSSYVLDFARCHYKREIKKTKTILMLIFLGGYPEPRIESD